MKKYLPFVLAVIASNLFLSLSASSQQYKLRQVTTMMGMKSESTIYVKGMRKRTEGGAMMGMVAPPVIIEQCDLKRYIKINDRKKLYFIEPFSSTNIDIIEEDKPKTVPKKTATQQKGGTIHMWYSIRDTNDRKKMYGFTARRILTSQKIKPSADACSMKDSMMVKTDGWYIDLPQFNCPDVFRPMHGGYEQPDCRDQYVMHRSGKGKLGFPLTQTTTIMMAGNEMQTNLETVELWTGKLDSMLFEIPPGYQLAKTEEELNEKIGLSDMVEGAIKNDVILPPGYLYGEKKPGTIRIAVFKPTGNDDIREGFQQLHMTGTLSGNKIEAIAVDNEEEARKYHCDYTLTTVFTEIKSSTKASGVLKAIRRGDPLAASNYDIKGRLELKKLEDGSIHTEQKIDGSYEGRIDEAAARALDEGCRMVLKTLK